MLDNIKDSVVIICVIRNVNLNEVLSLYSTTKIVGMSTKYY